MGANLRPQVEQVSVGDVPGVGRIRCWRKRPPAPEFYDEQPPPPPKEPHVEPSHTDAEMAAGDGNETASVMPQSNQNRSQCSQMCQPYPSVGISKPPEQDHDMAPVASLPEPHLSVEPRDTSDVEEGGSGQCGPTIGSGKEWMKDPGRVGWHHGSVWACSVMERTCSRATKTEGFSQGSKQSVLFQIWSSGIIQNGEKTK